MDILPGGLIATHPKGQSWHLPIEVAMMRIALHGRASGQKAAVRAPRCSQSSRRDSTIAPIGNRDQGFRDEFFIEQSKTDIFLAATYSLRSGCFEQAADSHQDALREIEDALMDLGIAELGALS
jgi:hypothetical protein